MGIEAQQKMEKLTKSARAAYFNFGNRVRYFR